MAVDHHPETWSMRTRGRRGSPLNFWRNTRSDSACTSLCDYVGLCASELLRRNSCQPSQRTGVPGASTTSLPSATPRRSPRVLRRNRRPTTQKSLASRRARGRPGLWLTGEGWRAERNCRPAEASQVVGLERRRTSPLGRALDPLGLIPSGRMRPTASGACRDDAGQRVRIAAAMVMTAMREASPANRSRRIFRSTIWLRTRS